MTGANSGIGRAIAITLGEQGATVAVHYLAKTELHDGAAHTALGDKAALEVAGLVHQKGGRAELIAADLSIKDEIVGLIALVEAANDRTYRIAAKLADFAGASAMILRNSLVGREFLMTADEATSFTVRAAALTGGLRRASSRSEAAV